MFGPPSFPTGALLLPSHVAAVLRQHADNSAALSCALQQAQFEQSTGTRLSLVSFFLPKTTSIEARVLESELQKDGFKVHWVLEKKTIECLPLDENLCSLLLQLAATVASSAAASDETLTRVRSLEVETLARVNRLEDTMTRARDAAAAVPSVPSVPSAPSAPSVMVSAAAPMSSSPMPLVTSTGGEQIPVSETAVVLSCANEALAPPCVDGDADFVAQSWEYRAVTQDNASSLETETDDVWRRIDPLASAHLSLCVFL